MRSGNLVYVNGGFFSIGGQDRYAAAALDALTGLATGWNPSPCCAGYVQSLAISGSNVFFGGEFSVMGGQNRKNLASVDVDTGLATEWDPNIDANTYYYGPQVSTVTISGNRVYVGGQFSAINGAPRGSLAALTFPDEIFHANFD